MLLCKRDASDSEKSVINELYLQKMGSSDKLALTYLLLGIASILYGISYHQKFIGWSSVLFFILAYKSFLQNMPIENLRKKADQGFEVIEYEGTIQIQHYGCCNSRRVSIYIDEYELTSFNPTTAPEQVLKKWKQINPHLHYKVVVTFPEDLEPVIFSLEQLNLKSTDEPD